MTIGARPGRLENVDETLRALKRIDPDLRRRVPNEVKGAAQGLLAQVKAQLPGELTTGSTRTRGKWRYPARARSQTVLKFRGTRPRSTPVGAFPLLRIVTRNPALAAAEFAQRPQTGIDRRGRPYGTNRGDAYIGGLAGRRGGRYIWPTVEAGADRVERDVEKILERYERIVSGRLR